jgi:hypothetical protein
VLDWTEMSHRGVDRGPDTNVGTMVEWYRLTL